MALFGIDSSAQCDALHSPKWDLREWSHKHKGDGFSRFSLLKRILCGYTRYNSICEVNSLILLRASKILLDPMRENIHDRVGQSVSWSVGRSICRFPRHLALAGSNFFLSTGHLTKWLITWAERDTAVNLYSMDVATPPFSATWRSNAIC